MKNRYCGEIEPASMNNYINGIEDFFLRTMRCIVGKAKVYSNITFTLILKNVKYTVFANIIEN